jgi:ubiquinone/menaquinone biosynthesis C-methylase UbiE
VSVYISRNADFEKLGGNVWRSYNAGRIPSTTSVAFELLAKCSKVDSILDLGCGPGRSLEAGSLLGANKLVGLDINYQVTKLARSDWQTGPAVFVNSDANFLPFKDRIFDLVIAQAFFTVIPSFVERLEILEEVARVLRPQGLLYVGEFLQSQDKYYQDRYFEGLALTADWGSFPVRRSDGEIDYFAHHFTIDEIQDLLFHVGLSTIELRAQPMKTRSGNEIEGIALLAQRRYH